VKRFLGILFFIILTIPLRAQEFSGNGNDISIILTNIKAFSKAYMDADYDTMMSLYAENAKIFPPGTSIISEIDNIRQRWILPKGVKVVYHNVIPKEITVLEDTAYDYGVYEGSSTDKDNNITEWKGKYVIVWKKINNEWRIYLDIWNRIQEQN
jgi:ketosteroid isomerase-like protein